MSSNVLDHANEAIFIGGRYDNEIEEHIFIGGAAVASHLAARGVTVQKVVVEAPQSTLHARLVVVP